MKIATFLEYFELRLGFPILLDSTARAYDQWGVRGLPRTYVVGKGGRIIYDAEGGRDMDSEHIHGLLQALIDK